MPGGEHRYRWTASCLPASLSHVRSGSSRNGQVCDGIVGGVGFTGEHWTGVLEPLNGPKDLAQVRVNSEAGPLHGTAST
jgi:hypothetical protein